MQADGGRARLRAQWRELFKSFDAVICPVMPTPAYPHDHSPEQEAKARASKENLEKSGRYKRPIVTQIVPEAVFYRAEEYHQRYLEKRGVSSCHI